MFHNFDYLCTLKMKYCFLNNSSSIEKNTYV